MAGRTEQTRAYRAFKQEVERILYDADPYGMGSSVGAPRDEYSDAAARLIPILLQIADGDLEDAISDALLDSDDALRATLVATARRYQPSLTGGDLST